MKLASTSALLILTYLCVFMLLTSISKSEKLDEFSLGHVTKENYKELDWEDFRSVDKPLIARGVIDGFLSVTETSAGTYRISLYETLEAMEYVRPRRSFGISSEIFREGLSLETSQKNYKIFHKKWVRVYGVFESLGENATWPLADTIKCDSVEWKNAKGELVRSLD